MSRPNGRPTTDFCFRDHPRTPENTMVRTNGSRECRVCKRERDKERSKKNAPVKKRKMLAPGVLQAKLDAASPTTVAIWFHAWEKWEHYRDENVLTLRDERQEALFRLAYRHASEFSELLEEVQAIR